MNRDPDRLYDLLPPVYRDRDVAQGYALRGLLRVIAEQAGVVEDDIDGMYDNWFIETCAPWVVPYIGDLIGYQAVHSAGDPSGPADEGATILVPRREVANTIRFRRRKGTLPVLEDVAFAVTGWPARVVEFAPYLGITQPVRALDILPKPAKPSSLGGRLVDLRLADSLARLGTPFDTVARRPDLRGPGSSKGGRFNLPDVGVYVWRSKVYSVTRTRATRVNEGGKSPGSLRYTFDALGIEIPLYTLPNQGTQNGPLGFPEPIRRAAFTERKDGQEQASANYYGGSRSLSIWLNGKHEPLGPEQIVPANLGKVDYVPPPGRVAVDPERGLIAFRTDMRPDLVEVEYHYAFPMDLGGGEYERALPETASDHIDRVDTSEKLADVVDQWQKNQPAVWVIEFSTSGVYTIPESFEMAPGSRLTLRAANKVRAVLQVNNGDTLTFTGGAVVPAPPPSADPTRCGLVLDGLLVMGSTVRIEGDFSDVLLRHCTFVPGVSLGLDLAPLQPDDPSLILAVPAAAVIIDHCIVGFTQVVHGLVPADPCRLDIADSILDATDGEKLALRAPDCTPAHARLTVARSTVRGAVSVHALDAAQDSIFDGKVSVARSQEGCMRFCYVRPDGKPRTPRRFECQPPLVGDADSIRLRFESTRYGSPAYCRLAVDCAKEIRFGAEDESEMGVYHDLLEPQRLANLRTRLDEFTPAALRAVAILAT